MAFILALWLVLAAGLHAAHLEYYVDTDVVGGAGDGSSWANAYSTASACLAAKKQNLTDGGGDTCTIWLRASSGTADTTSFDVDGWTLNATCYLTLRQFDFPTDGIWSDTAYRLVNNDDTGYAIRCMDTNVYFVNMQILVQASGTNNRYGIYSWNCPANSEHHVNSCIIKGQASGTGLVRGIYVNDADIALKIYDTVMYGFVSTGTPGDDSHIAIMFGLYTGASVLNCTIWNNYYGIYNQGTGPDAVIINCINASNADDFYDGEEPDGWTIDYCASDDGDGTNAQGPSGGSWANELTNAGAGIFTLVTGGNCINNGTDNPGAGLYSTDITGTAWTSPWDIGAFQYVSVPPTPSADRRLIHILQHDERRRRP